jgi:Transcriptional activator of glycolytic enzymes
MNKTVSDVWQEYKYGINGFQSIEFLDQKHGSTWRKLNTEAQMYARRKSIWNTIINMLDTHCEADAVAHIQNIMDEGKMSLNQLATHLKNNR